MCSASPPPAPDYVGAAKQQGDANLQAARTSAVLSNPNITTPLGTQKVTWGGGSSFDQGGYDKAMSNYQNQLGQWQSQNSQPVPVNDAGRGVSFYGSNGTGSADSPGGTDGMVAQPINPNAMSAAPVAPTREQYTSTINPDQANVVQSLSPEQQKLFDQQNRISGGLGGIAEDAIGNVRKVMGTPFDTKGLPGMNGSVDSRSGSVQNNIDPRFDQSGQQVQDALYRKQTAMLDPQYAQRESQMTSRLANQGIMQGSEAYNNAVGNFTRGRDADYANARDASILAGGNEQSRLFGLGLNSAQLNNQSVGQQFNQDQSADQFGNQARQQALQEAAFLRQMPLNEISALRSGSQVQLPQFQGYSGVNTQAGNVAGALGQQAQYNQGLYNANQASNASNANAAAGLGAAAMMATSMF